MSNNVHVVIPARFSSSRLPGKPLLDINGLPMIQHVYERANSSTNTSVVVATDDQRIFDTVASFGGTAVMTSDQHESGTDRLAEVAMKMAWSDDTIVVNLQGDEPLIDPALVDLVSSNLVANASVGMTTLATSITDRADVFNPNIVKVVCDSDGKALYFSRAPIPWIRGDYDQDDKDDLSSDLIVPYRHLGIYAYRVSALKKITALPPAPMEQAESLEQLRALWNGIGIHVGIIDEAPGHGVDTQEDLERVRKILAERAE